MNILFSLWINILFGISLSEKNTTQSKDPYQYYLRSQEGSPLQEFSFKNSNNQDNL